MIALFLKFNKRLTPSSLNIDEYYKTIDNIQSYQIKCPCGCKGSCIKYGWHKRQLIIEDNTYSIKLQRVYCKHCKTTHIIMPTYIIPYERQTMDYVLDLISSNTEINKADYELVRYTSIFSIWQNKLKSIGMKLCDDLDRIISFCATTFRMCFMQSKKRKNIKLHEVGYFKVALPT